MAVSGITVLPSAEDLYGAISLWESAFWFDVAHRHDSWASPPVP
ncbi:hypothetical protein BMS3Abin02_01893 [bacterium BMS3Abin02]|nr:hypothetical protein BMS3Abin02_01893 [bacterium BMS3Abin02]GBE20752.1 hypothetical protein BMS3Bbin01_00091 [bacterium BMS3Bbin01]